jgi:DNA-binding response OmpR family regulator
MTKILVVDDEQLTADLLTTYLTMKGFEVVRAERARDGATSAVNELPDAMIVDMMMPDMSGDQLCRVVRENPSTQHIPILILSALFTADAQRRARQAGANDFVAKTAPLPELLNRLNRLLAGDD